MSAILERSSHADIVNALANDPTIRPTIGGDIEQPLDLTAAVADDRNVVLMGEHGGFILAWTSPASYEVHTLIRPEGRGAWALQAARLCLSIMADAYGARQVWTRIKSEQRNTRNFAVAAGMHPCGRGVFDLGFGPEAYCLYEARF